MSKHLERDIEALERELLALSSIAEEMISKACRALRDRDRATADGVTAQDATVDQREVAIEEECLKILALHQPVAVDLRRVAAVLKINNDLERIADLAVNISQRAIALVEFPDFAVPELLQRMGEAAGDMVRTALDAFVQLDVQRARRVCAADGEVDAMYREAIERLQAEMQQDPRIVVPAMHCFSAARHLERIADHATNIGEDVMYLIEGEITRHRTPVPAAPAS